MGSVERFWLCVGISVSVAIGQPSATFVGLRAILVMCI
jgi:hypothetical protein